MKNTSIISTYFLLVSTLLVGNGCPTPTCTDGVQNGDETGVDCGGTCSPCVAGKRYVFLTPFEHTVGTPYNPGVALESATFASAEDADKICQASAEANDSVLKGHQWAAWIRADGKSPYERIIERIENEDQQVFLPDDNTIIAQEIGTCGTLYKTFNCNDHLAAINQFPNKEPFVSSNQYELVWIGDEGYDCNNWVNNTAESTVGNLKSFNSEWRDWGDNSCAFKNRLYCIMVDK